MEFVAIDFETANETRASACSCGIAVVADGQIVEKRHWLIRPHEDRFNAYNVKIHGIDRAKVADQPKLCDLWEEISPYLEGRVILAHNASFDMSVLRNSLDCYGLAYPQLEYSCTYLMARQVWHDWACFTLAALAVKLDIDFTHHDAGDDARACAQVALMAAQHLGAASIDDLEELISVYRGRLERDHYCAPYHPGRRGERTARFSTPIRYKDMKPEAGEIDQNNPLFGRKVVFTGALQSLGREEAAQLVVNNGGCCTDSVSKKTHFVVVGELQGGVGGSTIPASGDGVAQTSIMAGAGGGGGAGINSSNVIDTFGGRGGATRISAAARATSANVTGGVATAGLDSGSPLGVITPAGAVSEWGGVGGAGGASLNGTGFLLGQAYGKGGGQFGGGGGGGGSRTNPAPTSHFNEGGPGAAGICIVVTTF